MRIHPLPVLIRAFLLHDVAMTTDLILGTAGHIDHGKTSLINALTGIDTDRLPEEKRRGITIELGFAEMTLGDFRLGIVDVPGHERFVRNMLAGATGMDLAMLVVAADDSIKQQTREHLEILRLLNLAAGVIAITKCDLVEPDWLELVEEEIQELVAGSFLASASIVRTSSSTGTGLDDLREEIVTAARRAAGLDRVKHLDTPFRMAIDRCFTLAGHGTVVTGSAGSGTVAVGDELELQPSGTPVRVRRLHNHDREAENAHRGQRVAINLAGVHHDEIHRGQELAARDYLKAGKLLTVWLLYLDSSRRPLKHRSQVRLHLGTAEIIASLVLLDQESLAPGESCFAQLFLHDTVATTWNQPFVLRSESPAITIGGGQVLVPSALKLRGLDDVERQMLTALRSDDALQRASAASYFSGLRSVEPQDLARLAGVEHFADVHQQLLEAGELLTITISPTRTAHLHSQVIESLCQRFEAALSNLHEQNPLRSSLDRAPFVRGFEYLGESAIIEAVLNSLHQSGRIRLTAKSIAMVGCGPKLSQNERKLLATLITQYRDAGLGTPTVKEAQQRAKKNQDSVPQLIALAANDGDLVEITSDYFVHTEVLDQVQQTLRGTISPAEGVTMSQIRECLSTTRKFAIPLCEYFDRIGFTRRDGDIRYLVDP